MRISAAIIDEECLMDDTIYDQCPSEKDKNTKGHSHDSYLVSAGISQNHFQDMLKKFKLLTMSDPSSGFYNKTNLKAQSQQFMSSAKEMEDVKGSSIPLDTEPAWLRPYFEKMKEEIKREIIDELLFAEKMCNAVPKQCKETETKESNEMVHKGIFCDNCDQVICGIRYKCGNCSDYDLCQKCENLPNIHYRDHIFLKIRYSVPQQFHKFKNTASSEVGQPNAGKIPDLSHHFLQNVLQISKRHRNLIKTCKIFQAEYIQDETVPDGTVIAPSIKFVKSWRVKNSGNRSWTKDTKLCYVWGSKDLRPTLFEVDVPCLKPGEQGIVSVILEGPSQPGMYQGHWKFRHKNSSFGHFLWCSITVASESDENNQESIEVNVSINAIDVPGVEVISEKENDNKKKEAASIAQVLTAVKEEHDRGNIIPRKLVVTSHTATPTNTPFDLTPPKSPEPQKDSGKDLQETITSAGGSKLNSESDFDDDGSILSLSSSESDTEFVVIPMPRCFNMSESFVTAQSQSSCSQCSQLTWTVSKDNRDVNEDKIFEEIEKLQLKEFPASRTCISETVSQETGVPEVSENVVVEAVVKLENAPENKQNTVHLSRLSVGGSSSEVSIIESDESSPSIETFPLSIESVRSATSCSVGSNEARVKVMIAAPDVMSKTLPADECQDECHTAEEQITFPKFPVEGIEADLLIPEPDDKTVQVIPERLLTGALSAAATVYNTARAVISSMQHPRNEQETCLSREFEASNQHQPVARIPHPRELDPMEQLIEMGFCNRQLNEQYLHKHKGDVAMVVSDLVNLNDNDWYASRHNQTLHTNFD